MSDVIDLHKQDEEVFDVRISVSREFHDHYNKIIAKRDQILEDEAADDKSVIGILNSTTVIMRDLVKIQQDLYNSEKFAILQQIIVNVLKDSEPEAAEKVIKAFERKLGTM